MADDRPTDQVMSERRIYYFDNNATTRIDPVVLESMMPFLTEYWGNPSSAYQFGHRVSNDIESARGRVADLIHADPREVTFTSCGTESINTAIQSALATQPEKRHVITTSVEHSATYNVATRLRTQGYDVTFLPVDRDGSIDICLFQQSIRPDTALASVMWANNETGVLFPVDELAAICRSQDVCFHTDAVQVAGKLPIDVHAMGVDLLSLSAHKLHAPKGVGMLYVRRGLPYSPFILGGNQERRRRGGTENVASIVGFGRAAELAADRLTDENTRVRALRDRMESAILREIPKTSCNGSRERRLPNTSNLAFEGLEAEAILLLLDQVGICASSGSACTTGSLEPSRILTSMGLSRDRARGSIRFSLSCDNSAAEVDYLLAQLPAIINRLRAGAPDATVPEPAVSVPQRSV